jgi:hypothetical protein
LIKGEIFKHLPIMPQPVELQQAFMSDGALEPIMPLTALAQPSGQELSVLEKQQFSWQFLRF